MKQVSLGGLVTKCGRRITRDAMARATTSGGVGPNSNVV